MFWWGVLDVYVGCSRRKKYTPVSLPAAEIKNPHQKTKSDFVYYSLSKPIAILYKMNEQVIAKVTAIREMDLPYDMTDYITSYLFYDRKTWLIRQAKKELNQFIGDHIIRYEQKHKIYAICQWGIGFLKFGCPQIQGKTCLKCGQYICLKNRDYSENDRRLYCFCSEFINISVH